MFSRLTASVRRFFHRSQEIPGRVRGFLTGNEEGASLVEYALLVALIALACIVAIEALGGGISTAFNNIKATLTGKI